MAVWAPTPHLNGSSPTYGPSFIWVLRDCYSRYSFSFRSCPKSFQVRVMSDMPCQIPRKLKRNADGGITFSVRNLTFPTHFLLLYFCDQRLYRLLLEIHRFQEFSFFIWFVPPSRRLCARRPDTYDLFKTTWINVADQIVLGHRGNVLRNGSGLGGRLTGGCCRCIGDGSAVNDIR